MGWYNRRKATSPGSKCLAKVNNKDTLKILFNMYLPDILFWVSQRFTLSRTMIRVQRNSGNFVIKVRCLLLVAPQLWGRWNIFMKRDHKSLKFYLSKTVSRYHYFLGFYYFASLVKATEAFLTSIWKFLKNQFWEIVGPLQARFNSFFFLQKGLLSSNRCWWFIFMKRLKKKIIIIMQQFSC